MPITADEGKKFAADFMTAFQAGFAGNNHGETMKDLVADEGTWNWSDGTKSEGKEKMQKIFDTFATTWGFMVDSFNQTNPIVTVDTDNSKIVIAANAFINITGGLPESNIVGNNVVFLLTLDDAKKVCVYDGYWDNKDPAMLAALGKVSAKLEEAKAASA